MIFPVLGDMDVLPATHTRCPARTAPGAGRATPARACRSFDVLIFNQESFSFSYVLMLSQHGWGSNRKAWIKGGCILLHASRCEDGV